MAIVLAGVWEWHAVMGLGSVYEDGNWQLAAVMAPRYGVFTRPVSTLLWRLPMSLPVAHSLSLGLHVVNSALLLGIARKAGWSLLGAVIACGVFFLLPIQSEAVSYLSARSELLAAFGVLLACWCWLDEHWFLGGFALALGLLSKETAIVALVAMPLLLRQWRAAVIVAVLLMAWAAAYSAMRLVLVPDLASITSQIVATGHWLQQAVWPNALTVDVHYREITPGVQFLSAVLVGAVAALGWTVRRTMPLVAVGLLWTIALVAMRWVIVSPGAPLNAHQMYLAMGGPALALGAVLSVDVR